MFVYLLHELMPLIWRTPHKKWIKKLFWNILYKTLLLGIGFWQKKKPQICHSDRFLLTVNSIKTICWQKRKHCQKMVFPPRFNFIKNTCLSFTKQVFRRMSKMLFQQVSACCQTLILTKKNVLLIVKTKHTCLSSIKYVQKKLFIFPLSLAKQVFDRRQKCQSCHFYRFL